MERLTYRSTRFNNPVSNGACEKIKCSAKCDSCKINDLIAKLCAYEDTGLEPQDIISAVDMSKIACALHELNAYKDLGPIDHIRDLIKAEQDGRLVVLPCKVGDTVYQIDAERVYESEVKWIIFDCDDIAFDERAIGVSIFLTREEAEAALKGGESDA